MRHAGGAERGDASGLDIGRCEQRDAMMLQPPLRGAAGAPARCSTRGHASATAGCRAHVLIDC
eukprot:2255962-Prymnesium_polylepis.1